MTSAFNRGRNLDSLATRIQQMLQRADQRVTEAQNRAVQMIAEAQTRTAQTMAASQKRMAEAQAAHAAENKRKRALEEAQHQITLTTKTLAMMTDQELEDSLSHHERLMVKHAEHAEAIIKEMKERAK